MIALEMTHLHLLMDLQPTDHHLHKQNNHTNNPPLMINMIILTMILMLSNNRIATTKQHTTPHTVAMPLVKTLSLVQLGYPKRNINKLNQSINLKLSLQPNQRRKLIYSAWMSHKTSIFRLNQSQQQPLRRLPLPTGMMMMMMKMTLDLEEPGLRLKQSLQQRFRLNLNLRLKKQKPKQRRLRINLHLWTMMIVTKNSS
jgi:hypothetical protein